MTVGRALLVGAGVALLVSCASGSDQGPGADAGCPGSSIPCCSGGCNGEVVREGTCTNSGNPVPLRASTSRTSAPSVAEVRKP